MTSSKSSKWFSRAVVVALLLFVGFAHAEGRKRLVVLDFDGDEEAASIHKSMVKFLKKDHTVISVEKWNEAAEKLGATKITEKNVKKVAKDLKVDGVITGNVEKRREEFIIRITLRAGATGALVGSKINAKTDAPKLSKQTKSDLRDELFPAIEGLESVRGSGGSEEEEEPAKEEEKEKPSKFGGKQMKNEEEEEETAKLSKKEEEKKKKEEEKKAKEEEKKAKEEEEKRAKEEKKKKAEEEKEALATKKDSEEEEESPLPKPKKEKKPKKVSKTEEGEEEGIEESADEPTGGMTRREALSPGNRAVDAVVGVSMNMRRMSFSYDQNIGTRPAGYKGKMVPGGFLDMTFYPLALGHKRRDILKNIGATFMYDQVLLVKSQDAAGKELKSAQVRYAFGAVFRYPFNANDPNSMVIGGRLRYGSQAFKISQPAPLPSVTYSMIEPGIFFRMPLMSGKLVLDANAAFLGILDAGQIQKQDKYGGATLTGFEMNVGADYHLADALFLRGMINYETIGYAFKKNGMLPAPMDNAKVSGARDNYYGVVVTAGYLF